MNKDRVVASYRDCQNKHSNCRQQGLSNLSKIFLAVPSKMLIRRIAKRSI